MNNYDPSNTQTTMCPVDITNRLQTPVQMNLSRTCDYFTPFYVCKTQSCCVTQVGLELMVLLPQFPSTEVTGMYYLIRLHQSQH